MSESEIEYEKNSVIGFCKENGIVYDSSLNHFFFTVYGTDYILCNNNEPVPHDKYTILIVALRSRLPEIYKNLLAGYKINKRGFIISQYKHLYDFPDSFKLFFGDSINKIDTNIYQFKRVLRHGAIIIVTDNIYTVNSPKARMRYLVLGKAKGLKLNNWRVFNIIDTETRVSTYAVKITKSCFSKMIRHIDLKEYDIDDDYTYNDLYKLAEKQEKENRKYIILPEEIK